MSSTRITGRKRRLQQRRSSFNQHRRRGSRDSDWSDWNPGNSYLRGVSIPALAITVLY